MARHRFQPGEPLLLWMETPRKTHEYLRVYRPGERFGTHKGELTFPEELYEGAVLWTHSGTPVWVLRPSLADLMMHVRRRTTILYPKDLGWIFFHTGLRPGARVLEVGTGSGAGTIALAYWLGPRAKIYSFERRPEFHKNAAQNLHTMGFADRVELAVMDLSRELPQLTDLDVLFVDVPEPWVLVARLTPFLHPGGSWVSLSPTVEQTLQTKRALQDAGYRRIRTVEIIEREWLIREGKSRPVQHMIGFTGFLTVAWYAENPDPERTP